MPTHSISVFSVKNSQYASAAAAAKNAWTYNWASHFKDSSSQQQRKKKPADETTQRQRLQQTDADDAADAGEDEGDIADAFGFITGYMCGDGARPKMIDAFLNNKYGGRWALACMYPWMEFSVEQKSADSTQWRMTEPMQLPSLRAAYMDTTTYGALRFILQNVLGRGDLMRTLGFDAHAFTEPLALTQAWLEAQHVELRKAVDECPPVFYLFYKPLYERLMQFYAHTVVPVLITLPGAVIRTACRWLDSPADCYRLAIGAFTHYKLPEMSISALRKRALLSDEQMLAVHVYQEVLKVDALATWRPQRAPEEVAAGLRYYSEQNGHDYTPLGTLRELVSPTRWRPPGSGRTAAGGLWTPALLDRALALLEAERIVVLDQERFVYLRPIYVWTTHCIRGIAEFCTSRIHIRDWYPVDARPDPQCNYAQRAAFEKARSMPIVLITGRGGTGKTFVVRSILAHLPRCEVLCAAPTGRAASVISEMSGYAAHTMHAILKNADEIGLERIRALVIDEMSMSGLELMSHFLTTIFARCVNLERVFLVGDHLQLPPIEGGCLMENLVTKLKPNPYIGLVRLTENKRSASAIMYHNQDAILSGRPELMHWDDATFSFVEVPDTHEAQRRALTEFFEANADNQENWHIITAKNDTANRVNNIYYDAHVRRNSALKRSIREENVRFRKFRAFQLVYPIGIKMAYTCNFNKIGITNGTVFVIEGYEDSVKDDDKKTLHPNHMLDRLPTKRSNKRAVRLRQARTENRRIECDVKKYDLRAKAKVAAASTVHKFQGSQTSFIYYLIHPGDSWVLTDRHLVTAIGRAENRVMVVAKKEEFEKAARTPWIERRSRFAEMLSETLTLGEARVGVS